MSDQRVPPTGLVILAFAAALAWPGVAQALPQVLAYGGRLYDSANTPLTGTYDITFRLCADVVGGVPLFVETHSLATDDGYFFVLLNSVQNDVSFELLFPSHDALFVELEVEGQVLAPRQALGPAAWALAAPATGGSGAFVDAGNHAYYVGGDVGIGTTAPVARLDVKGGAYFDMDAFGGTPTIDVAIGDTDTGFDHPDDGILDVYSQGTPVARFEYCSGGEEGLTLGTTASECNTELKIQASGNTSASYGLKILDSDGNVQVAARADGKVTIGAADPGPYALAVDGGDLGILGRATLGSAATRPFGVVADLVTSANANTGGGFAAGLNSSSSPNILYLFGANITMTNGAATHVRGITVQVLSPQSWDYSLELKGAKAYCDQAACWTDASSRELKYDIVKASGADLKGVLQEIAKTDLYYYRFKADADRDRKYLGVISEESPDWITTPDKKAISASAFASFLMAGLKAQQELLDSQARHLEKQATEIADLKALVCADHRGASACR